MLANSDQVQPFKSRGETEASNGKGRSPGSGGGRVHTFLLHSPPPMPQFLSFPWTQPQWDQVSEKSIEPQTQPHAGPLGAHQNPLQALPLPDGVSLVCRRTPGGPVPGHLMSAGKKHASSKIPPENPKGRFKPELSGVRREWPPSGRRTSSTPTSHLVWLLGCMDSAPFLSPSFECPPVCRLFQGRCLEARHHRGTARGFGAPVPGGCFLEDHSSTRCLEPLPPPFQPRDTVGKRHRCLCGPKGSLMRGWESGKGRVGGLDK